MITKRLLKVFLQCMLLASSLLLGEPVAMGQNLGRDPVLEKDQDSTQLITIIRADEAVGQRNIDSQKLLGDVILRQDSVYIFCDSATLVANRVRAEGNVALEKNDSINVFSDRAFYDGTTQKGFLYGDTVILTSGNQRLFAKDSLRYDLAINIAYYSNGAILIQDSTYIVSKRGKYSLDKDEITFYEDVVVKDSAFILVADSLKYNTTTRTVTFIAPTRITADSSRIYCERGTYNLDSRNGYFAGNPQVDNNEQQSTAEVIRFDQATGMIHLDGNAEVTGENLYANADEIFYNTKTKDILLEGEAFYQDEENEVSGEIIRFNEETKMYSTIGRSRVINPPMIIDADSLDFDQTTGLGYARGNVLWQDTSANVSIRTAQAEYLEAQSYFKAFGGRPLFASDIEGDSLYLSADTLLNLQIVGNDSASMSAISMDSVMMDSTGMDSLKLETPVIDSIYSDSVLTDSLVTDSLSAVASGPADTMQLLKAFNDVRIFKSNFQGLCDSLVYNQSDSLFYLYNDPIIWSDTSQFVADTILVQLRNNDIHRIYLLDNAFIINSPDELLFNQIKGRKITAYFSNGEIEKMHVEGNAQTVYYALDEANNYVGVNKTESSEMMLYFEQNEITKIKFLGPDANMLPIQSTDHEKLKIEGFNWKISERPKSVSDL